MEGLVDMKMNGIDVVNTDVAYMIENLNKELTELSGNKILLTGGGGFLGYYLINTIVGWNRLRNTSNLNTIDLVVYDNFMRGLPDWLSEFESKGLLTLKTQYIRPTYIRYWRYKLCYTCSQHCFSNLLSQTSNRNYGC